MIRKKSTYLILVILSLFAMSNKAHAQDNLSLSEIDKLTYKYYNTQQWDNLIEIGEKALKNNVAFFYLDYRMGLAYYAKKKYRKAIPFFQKVLETTPNDLAAKEYLYYSYLFGHRYLDASNSLYKFTKEHREKVEFHNTGNLFNSLGVEYKYYSFNDYAISPTVSSDIVQKTRNSMNYFSIDLLNYTHKNSILYLNLSFINGDNSIFDEQYSHDVINEKLKQYQFYISWNKRIADGFDIKISTTYMRENLKWYYTQTVNNSSVIAYDGSTNNYVGFASIKKNIKNIDLSVGSSFSQINEENQIQPFIALKWYPFNNDKFYTNTNISYQYNLNSENDNFIIKQSFTATINSKFNIKAFGLYGKVYNYIDNDGLSIYNNLDAIDYWYGVSANYYFSSKISLYLNYRNDGQTNTYTNTGVNTDIKYNVNSVLLGLRFNF